MQIEQHQSSPSYRWHSDSVSPRDSEQIGRSTPMTTHRTNQPLIFSIDDRLAEEHLTRLDLTAKHLKQIDRLPTNINFNIILLDSNEITKIEHLDIYPQLIQLSISHNRLKDIYLLSRIRSLQKLNLSHNLIDSIDCLRTLQNLVMLNISHNNIASLAVLNACHALQSLDASENALQRIEDLSNLKSLKYLNLRKNYLHTLIFLPRYLPKSLHTLILSENEIQDLTEISYLSSLINLNTFYIADNPCLLVNDQRYVYQRKFDYRPYVINWCFSIQNLDEMFVTRKESLKAEWLLSQGKGRSFGPGEHEELIQYLTRVCGIDTDERDDLHLSRIMQKRDLYSQQSTFMSESDYHRVDTVSPRSTMEQTLATAQQHYARTPSPGYMRSGSVTTTYIDDQSTETISTPRYSDYDNRPIKPLDQNMLQTKLNQYPIENPTTDNLNTSRSETKRTYNANRYSPKTTSRGPTAASTFYARSTRNPARQRHTRIKRQTTNSNTTHALRALHHLNENSTHRLTTPNKNINKERQRSTENDEVEYQSSPNDPLISTMNNSIELQKLTTSVETIRTSVLQAYLDLQEKFTKTTELQTSALSALWKKCETQHINHQRETEKILEENRLLTQRVRELELRLNTKPTSSSLKSNPNLHPPLRVHISKRDAKTIFLHWIPNPLNEHRTILGYRIYIDDVFKVAIDSGRFETVIDYIRDEGEYKIKVRTYDEHGESTDSNTVIARFRRQRSVTLNSESGMSIQPIQLDDGHQNVVITPREHVQTPIIMDRRHSDVERSPSQINNLFTPEKTTAASTEHISPHHLNANENIISLKPPKSPTSSPNKTGKTSPKTSSCNKALFTNSNSNDSTTITSIKRSPTRTGIMSRLAKHSHNAKRNNILLNALPIETTTSPTEVQVETKAVKRTITFEPDRTSADHGHILAQKIPIKASDILNSMDVQSLLTNSEILSSISSSSPPPPIPQRIPKNK